MVASQKFKDVSQQNSECIEILEDNSIIDNETAMRYNQYNGSATYAYDNRHQFCTKEDADEWTTASENEEKHTKQMVGRAISGGVFCAVGGLGGIAVANKILEIKKRKEHEGLEGIYDEVLEA